MGLPHWLPWVPLVGDLMGKKGSKSWEQERHRPQSQLDIDSDFNSVT